jgi:hypothetical protein
MKADPQEIYHRFTTKHKLSHMVTCAILGNMQQESNFETATQGFDGTGSTGLCQWLGVRLAQLKRFAKAKAEEYTDWEMQVDFVIYEFNSFETIAWKKVARAKTLIEATTSFAKYYERPHKDYAHIEKRIKYAQQFYIDFDPKRVLSEVPARKQAPVR